MFERIWQDGPLDALVNNAAANFLARSETLSPRAFDAIIAVALSGNAYCALAAGKLFHLGLDIPVALGTVFGILLVEGFVITTLDAAVRLNRYLFEEL